MRSKGSTPALRIGANKGMKMGTMIKVDAELPQWPGVQAAMNECQEWTKGSGKEMLILVNPEGKFIGKYQGIESNVSIPMDEVWKVEGNMVVHSHPTDAELSMPDLKMAEFNHAAGIFAVMPSESWSYCKGVRHNPRPRTGLEMADELNFIDTVNLATNRNARVFESVVGELNESLPPAVINSLAFKANRIVLKTFADDNRLIDYRLHLTEAGKLVFKGQPGLEL
jgi:hypothetical protein